MKNSVIVINDKVNNSVYKLNEWLEKNGWAGYDPYDVLGHPIWLKLSRLTNEGKFISQIENRLLSSLGSVFPVTLRKLFKIEKQINAKAMGLFASAYINLYNIKKEEKYLKKAQYCINYLIENPSKGYPDFCWGYPFHWQSRVFIPRDTPSAVVSSICGYAFWDFYKLNGEEKYLKICESICNFFINNLNIDVIDENKVCFSYTPIDKFHVHNANLFVAEFLIRVGNKIGNSMFVQMGTKAMNYTIAEQNADGSFYYWGAPDRLLHYIDHFHTGYVLRTLYSIYQITNDCQLLQSIKKCYNHYLVSLFEGDGIPKNTTDSKYPINIHSCAEAILCLSTLKDDFPEGLKILERVVAWTIDNMQDKQGYFYYKVLPRRIIKIPYIRLAQAWMLNALSVLEKQYMTL